MAAKSKGKGKRTGADAPVVENRKARHKYLIQDTLECGVKLTGTEIKSVRDGRVSLGEGFVRASADPAELTLHAVHIAEYPPAASIFQHEPTRTRTLLAHKREIRKLAAKTLERGVTLVPLKLYFVRGRAKLLIGVARGKRKADKRQEMSKQQAKRDIEREMARRR